MRLLFAEPAGLRVALSADMNDGLGSSRSEERRARRSMTVDAICGAEFDGFLVEDGGQLFAKIWLDIIDREWLLAAAGWEQ